MHEITVFDVTPTGRRSTATTCSRPAEHGALSELQEGQFVSRSGPKIVTMSYVNETDIIGCFGAKYQIHITHDGYVTPERLRPPALR